MHKTKVSWHGKPRTSPFWALLKLTVPQERDSASYLYLCVRQRKKMVLLSFQSNPNAYITLESLHVASVLGDLAVGAGSEQSTCQQLGRDWQEAAVEAALW